MPGLVIGKVAIKVLPDTDGFREKTKAALQGKEKPGQVKVKVIPELDEIAFRNIQRRLEGLGDTDVRISPNLDHGDMAQVQLALEGFKQIDLDINPMLDWALYTEALAALKEFSKPRLVEVGVWAKISSFKVTAARLATLTRDRIVAIKTVLDEPALRRTTSALSGAFTRLSGLRFTLESFAKFRQEMLNLDRLVPKIGLFANGLGYLSTVALTAGGSLLSVSAGLIQMGAAGLALPGILGGVAIGLGITAVALADFKKEVPQITSAWKTLRATISQNFWDEAGDGIRSLVDELFPLLTREAGKTATALGGFFDNLSRSLRGRLLPVMGEMFDNLNKSIDIFSKRTDAVANIIATLGKLGAKYLPRLARAFGDMTQNFSDWLTEADKAGRLTEWVDEGIERIKEFGRVLAATTSIFSSLAEAAERAGGATLGSVADSLERVAKAAASPGFQNGLTDTLSAAYDMMDQISSRVGPNLANLIESLSETFQEMAPVMGDTVATAVEAIADALSSAPLQNGLKRLLSGFNRMVNELAPAMQPLADKLGALGGVVGELAEAIGKVLGSAIKTVSPSFVRAAEAIQPLIDSLGELVSGLIDDLKPAFDEIAKQLEKPAIKNGIKDFGDALERLGDAIGPEVAAILSELVKAIGKFSEQDIANAVTVIDGIASSLESLNRILNLDDGGGSGGDNWFTSLLSSLLDATSLYSKLAKIVEAFQITKDAISNLDWGQVGRDVVNGLILGLLPAPLVEKAQELANALIDKVKSVLGIHSPSTVMAEIGRNVVQGLVNGLKDLSGITAFADRVKAIFESLRGTLAKKVESIRADAVRKFEELRSSASRKAEELRASLAQKWESIRANATQKAESLRRSVTSSISSARTAAIERVESIRSNLASKWSSIASSASAGWASIRQRVSSAVSQMRSAVISRAQGIVDYMRGLPGRIVGALGNLGGLLFSAGVSIMSGLISGISSKIGELSAVLDGITSLIPIKKGPIQKDRKLLTPAGIAIMNGLIKGIESEEGALIRTLKGLTDSIVDTLGTDVAMTVSADAAVSTASVARQITTASRAVAADSPAPAPAEPSITVENITISLEDLKQLKDLEEFFDLLRVRSRME